MPTPDLNATLQALSKSLGDLVTAQSRAARVVEDNSSQKRRETAELFLFTDEIVKGRKLNAEQHKIQDKLITQKRKEIELDREIEKAKKELKNAIKSDGANSEKATKAAKTLGAYQTMRARQELEVAKTAKQLAASFKGLLFGLDIAGTALTYFSAAVTNSVILAKEQMTANQGMIEGADYFSAMMTQQGQAFKAGISVVDFSKMVTANRQVINAMGGTAKTMDNYQGSLLEFYTMTGSITEANKLLLEATTSFAVKGIKPTSKTLKEYSNDVQMLSMQTGMGAEAIAQLYNSVADDTDSMTLLRAARADEREAILANQRALINNSIAQGMTAEQAKDAAKMLNKMVAAKPLDRIRQAAKMRAIGAALGIAGADEAANTVMHGKKNASKEQLEQLDQFQKNVTGAADKAAQGGLAGEIPVSMLLEKMGVEDQYGPGSPFSVTLGDVMAKNTKEVKEMYAKASESAIGRTLLQGETIIEQLKQIASGTIAFAAVSTGFISMFKFFNGEDASNFVYDAFVKSMPDFADIVITGVGKVGDLLGTYLKLIASGIANVASVVTGWVGLNNISESLKNVGADYFKSANELAHQMVGKQVPSEDGQPAKGKGKQPSNLARPAPIVPQDKTQLPGSTPDNTAAVAKPIVVSKEAKERRVDDKNVQRSEQALDAATTTATGIQRQLDKMDQTAVMMKTLVDNSHRSVELAEKQLVALTMTDKEKSNSTTTVELRKDNKFAAKYGYV